MIGARRAALWSLLVGLCSPALGCQRHPRPVSPEGWPLAFAPQSAAFVIPVGSEASQDFELTGSVASGAVLTLAGGGDPDLQIETLAGTRGRNPGLRIHATGRSVGVRVGTLLVATGLPAPREVPLLYSLRVEGTLRIAPTNPIIDPSTSGGKATFIEVASAQADFVVTAVEIEKGPFVASMERGAQHGTFRVTVMPLGTQVVKGSHGAVGTLVIRSNDAAEPRKEIPLFAFGAGDAPR